MPSDIEIAQAAKMQRIAAVAREKLGIAEEHLEPYGHYKAKVSLKFVDSLKGRKNGRLILVTAISPTPAGEGKTTTTVGLGDALNHIGKKAVICLREPSLGPVFGVKGGAAGGGYAQVVPMEDINLHFTGDFNAIGLANNLLAAAIERPRARRARQVVCIFIPLSDEGGARGGAMALVAITREMGSLGKDVASGLAEALGVPLVYHEVIDHLADRMRVRKSHVIRLLDGSAGLLERLTADKTSMSIFSADEIVNLALQGKGAVIRGWGATHLLRDVPHAVCVRVCAPFELRKRRMMERVASADEAKIADEIQQNDASHAAIMRRNFSVQWTDAEHYDLVLNTERASVKACVEQVMALVKSPEFAETKQSRERLQDLALVWHVRAALRVSPRTRDIRITVKAQGGRLVLTGLLDNSEQRTAVNEVAASAGARDIDDQLRSADAVRPRFQ